MKAVVIPKYGSAKDLQIREMDKPVPTQNQVLVKVRAVAINDWDWSLVRGKPTILRLLFGVPKPKYDSPGIELSGTVEELGPGVSSFKIGDEVFGDLSQYNWGCFSEFASVHEKSLVAKPSKMTFEEAAALSHAANLAYQGMMDLGELKKDMKILINGAGGGVGTFGLQLAKMVNANVTGVDSGAKLDAMKTLGFGQVIDYKKEDFTKNGLKYDLILDAKTTRSPLAYLRSLNPAGRYITVGGDLTRLLQLFILGPFLTATTKKQLKVLGLQPNKDLERICQLFLDGILRPVIDGPYPLEEAPRWIQYFGEGKHTGKVVLTVGH